MVDLPSVKIDAKEGFNGGFGRGEDNKIGLHLKFDWDGTTARTEITPGENFQGWRGVIHGGILCCILDEVMCEGIWQTGRHGVTAGIRVNFKQPAKMGETLVAEGTITSDMRRLVETEGRIIRKEDGTLIAEATGSWYAFGGETGKRRKQSK